MCQPAQQYPGACAGQVRGRWSEFPRKIRRGRRRGRRNNSSPASRVPPIQLYRGVTNDDRETLIVSQLSCLLRRQILAEPGDPAPVDIAGVNRVAGAVAGYGAGDELRWHAVVAQRVIELERLRDGHAEVAGIGGNQGRLLSFGYVVDGRLLAVRLHTFGIGVR